MLVSRICSCDVIFIARPKIKSRAVRAGRTTSWVHVHSYSCCSLWSLSALVTLSSPPSRDLIKLTMVANATLQQRFCDVTMQHRKNVGNVNERNKILAGTLHKLDLNVFSKMQRCNATFIWRCSNVTPKSNRFRVMLPQRFYYVSMQRYFDVFRRNIWLAVRLYKL